MYGYLFREKVGLFQYTSKSYIYRVLSRISATLHRTMRSSLLYAIYNRAKDHTQKMDMVTQIVQTHAPYLRWDSGPGIILAETIWGTLDAHGFEQPGQRVVQQKYSRPYVSKPRHTKQQIFEVWDIHDKYDLICNEYANKLPRIIGKPGCAASIREDFGETYLSLFTV
ncbi:hypothetical protein EhV164_00275 [Emiliania huxleyi virus 164]|nr:hypothetical protein EhV164_00275 [Emiliania huxleyi virus 164]